jgi:hypothetical protein
VLKQLELENDGAPFERKVRRVDFDHGGPPHMRANQLIRRGDGLSIDGSYVHWKMTHAGFGPAMKQSGRCHVTASCATKVEREFL